MLRCGEHRGKECHATGTPDLLGARFTFAEQKVQLAGVTDHLTTTGAAVS
jgi:hypothetical protein